MYRIYVAHTKYKNSRVLEPPPLLWLRHCSLVLSFMHIVGYFGATHVLYHQNPSGNVLNYQMDHRKRHVFSVVFFLFPEEQEDTGFWSISRMRSYFLTIKALTPRLTEDAQR